MANYKGMLLDESGNEFYPKIKIYRGSVTSTLTVSANGSNFTNLSTLINDNMPSGYEFLCISGFTTNSQYIVPVSLRYVNTEYSLQVKNVSSNQQTAQIIIYYVAITN